MGKWGLGLYDDDSAIELKEDYQVLLAFGVPELEAFELVKEHVLKDMTTTGEDNLFWLALARIQHKYGILLTEVKEKSLYILENIQDEIKASELTKKETERVCKHAEDLRSIISSPLPPKAKVPKPIYDKHRWNEGDIILSHLIYEDKKDEWYYNKYVLYRVICVEKTPLSYIVPELAYSESAWVVLFDWIGKDIPDVEVLKTLTYVKYADLGYGTHIIPLDWFPKREKLTLFQTNCDLPLPCLTHPLEYYTRGGGPSIFGLQKYITNKV